RGDGREGWKGGERREAVVGVGRGRGKSSRHCVAAIDRGGTGVRPVRGPDGGLRGRGAGPRPGRGAKGCRPRPTMNDAIASIAPRCTPSINRSPPCGNLVALE
ncbi:MAG: hypothetical protein H8D67_05880, partial [Deltaproteobacteria bacterium]|nr:hypothetical protein [Deltaproteobacteria bacterium]